MFSFILVLFSYLRIKVHRLLDVNPRWHAFVLGQKVGQGVVAVASLPLR